jgi:hypothetical protein
MSLTPECQAYIDTHLYENQDELLKKIGSLLPTGASNIHWDKIPDKYEAHSIQRDKLIMEILATASLIDLKESETIMIINIDDAFPAIITTLKEWQPYAQELDYVNTLYVNENNSKIIHWDFYKNLYALKTPSQ